MPEQPTPCSRKPHDGIELPSQPIDRILQPIARFLHVEATSRIVLLLFTIVALVLANSPWSQTFLDVWKTPIGFSVGSFEFRHSLKHLINDGLMAVFFFVIGLEVKREIALGELREIRRALLPIAAALGGVIVPAAIYLAFQRGEPGENGWGIPMATDIAFVVGCMALLGARVPHGLRVLLLSLAIVDDIFAILVIALVYAGNLSWLWLTAGLAGIGLVYAFMKLGIRSYGVYALLAVMIWFAFHESGVHATIAGVILGLMAPPSSYVSETLYREVLDRVRHTLRGDGFNAAPDLPAKMRRLQWVTREVVSPLEYMINALHPWVAFVIMPLFAFANAGVPFWLPDIGSPVAIAVILGLSVGKPVGIVLASWFSVRLRVASLPAGVTWTAMIAAGCLAGIGFTMALFIAGLALVDPLLDMAKIGVLAGSFLSAVVGMTLLRSALPDPQD